MAGTTGQQGCGAARARIRDFRTDKAGQIAILFALSLTAISAAVGGGIDLGRAYMARQKLSQVATLACQYASRPSVIQTVASNYSGANGASTYRQNVNNYISASVTNQALGFTQTNATPFTFTANGPADVSLTATVPTTFMSLLRIAQLPIAAGSHCYDNPSSIDQTVPNGSSPYLVQEGFETINCAGTCYAFYSPTGTNTPRTTPQNTFPSSPGYTGQSGASWYIMGYCVEVDTVGVIRANVPEGTHSAELDCDNGSGNQGNSSISSQLYLPVGNYEIRYNFASRVAYPDYDPAYLCGSTASDLSWANSTNSVGSPVVGASRSNQINVYLDLSVGGAPPTHATIDASQTLAGSNLIDQCVHSTNWVERSIRVYVSTPGFYWLSFAADGQNDSYGGQIDNVRLCPESCTAAVQDNYPPAWLAANNGGVNKVLYQDPYDLPVYAANYYGVASTNGNLNLSLGTSGLLSGWPGQTASGWATGPYNEVFYMTTGSSSGTQSLQLDSTSPGTTNRSISHPFLLDPGYYKLDYAYISNVTFPGLTGPNCGATPAAAGISSLSGSTTGTVRVLSSPLAANRDTNIVGVFLAHSQLASTPVGGGALNSQTSYTNPNSTVTTTPTVPPYGVSLTSYNASQPNPLLDICGYATTWQARTANFKILKPAYYWLTFAALGTADGVGGVVDSVKVTALGSLAMGSPPSSPVTIPVPDPQPGTTTSFTGLTVVADPLTVPAPDL